jgi:hypothetical protein
MISRYPWNLQIIPYLGTECAVKKQMSPIFKSDLMTKDAIMVISNMPVSPDNCFSKSNRQADSSPND